MQTNPRIQIATSLGTFRAPSAAATLPKSTDLPKSSKKFSVTFKKPTESSSDGEEEPKEAQQQSKKRSVPNAGHADDEMAPSTKKSILLKKVPKKTATRDIDNDSGPGEVPPQAAKTSLKRSLGPEYVTAVALDARLGSMEDKLMERISALMSRRPAVKEVATISSRKRNFAKRGMDLELSDVHEELLVCALISFLLSLQPCS